MTAEPTNSPIKVYTIGAFGFDPVSFFDTLKKAGVDTFCDIRWRRGVRGAEFAFVNSARLQRRLDELGIRYFHLRDLAPTPALRERQAEADRAAKVAKRKRATLGEKFIEGYRTEHLANFNSAQFLERLGSETRSIVLFCVERDPAACHRSLLAERLQADLGAEVVHLLPSPPAT